MNLLRGFVNANLRLSKAVDSLLPSRLRLDGNKTFLAEFIPRAVGHGEMVYDIGGGARPFISLHRKKELDARVVGLDISEAELKAAPEGVYDRMIVHDLCTFEGDALADVVVCQALLEHVPDSSGAMRALASAARDGGRIFLFAPARNALFARLNLLLPENFKRKLLFALFPGKAKGHDGFRAYYDRCTPSQIEMLAAQNGLEVEQRRIFWISSYFMAFFPAYLFWRAYQGISALFIGDDAAESFIYVFRKRAAA